MGVWTIEVAVQVTDLILQITERKNYAKQSDEQNQGIKISKKISFPKHNIFTTDEGRARQCPLHNHLPFWKTTLIIFQSIASWFCYSVLSKSLHLKTKGGFPNQLI